jgi:putative ABC transport system ATP-binding protein
VLPEGVAIACTSVSRTYATPAGRVEALTDVDAAFAAGTLGALVGPSGCGKSTLLRLLAGLDAPDAGSIAAGGIDVGALRGRDLRRYRRGTVTYVAQRAAANLVPHLTLREHLEAGAGTDLLERLGLTHRLDARAGQLSGGEQARAALGIALARPTPLLLADEPTAELDREAAAHVLEALRAVTTAGRAVIVATHDPELVEAADATVVLERAWPATPAARPNGTSERGPAALEARNIVKTYGSARVVDDATLDLAQGELGILLGRSGSGKSTLLMAAGGWLVPDDGSIRVAGAGLAGPPPWERLSYVAQRFGLLPELSVAENVALPLRLAGLRDDDRVRGLLDLLGLQELAGRTPPETSVGQQQRTALARALVRRPAVLLADEPTSHQDGGHAERVWGALRAACAEGTAALVATHDPAAAARGDRVWEIADGRLAAAASPPAPTPRRASAPRC